MRLLFLLLICWQAIAQTAYNHTISVGNATFSTEIADTTEKMQRGMMFRSAMADNQAMLFVFSKPQQAHFWMKNTLLSLDMLFFDEVGRLVEIKNNVQPCKVQPCPIYASAVGNIQYVLEIKGGMAKKQGINVGDNLQSQ